MSEYKNINKITIQYSPGALEFNYKFKKVPKESEMFDVFYRTKELILTEKFQNEFFKKFFSTYTTGNEKKYYPNAFVNFDLNNDGKDEYQFESQYNERIDSSDSENEAEGYITWTYWDFKSEGKLVPEQK